VLRYRQRRVLALDQRATCRSPHTRSYGASGERRHDRRSKTQSTEYPTPHPNDLSRSLAALEQDSTLIAVIEMSQKSWLVGAIVPGIERHPLKKLMPDEDELLRLLHRWRDEATKAGRTITRPASPASQATAMTRRLRAHGIGACHPCLERGDLARASPGEDRSSLPRRRPGRAVETSLSRLAAGRARSLQNGRDPRFGDGRRQAAGSRAREAGRRAHPPHQPRLIPLVNVWVMSRGELASGAIDRATSLYSVDPTGSGP